MAVPAWAGPPRRVCYFEYSSTMSCSCTWVSIWVRAGSECTSTRILSGMTSIQPGAHGVLPPLSARNDRSNLFEIFIAHDRFDFIASIFARDDNNSIDSVGALKCAYCMSNDWFPGNRRKQFIETHAAAVTTRNNDGR